jgi:hypothetical protein
VVLNLRALVDQLAATLGAQQQLAQARAKLQGETGQKLRAAAQQKLGVTLPPSAGQLVIMRSDQLGTIQKAAKAIRGLSALFTVLSLGLFALAVGLAVGWRRVALRRVGWSFVALGVGMLVARRLLGDRVVEALVADPSVKPAADATWKIGTTLLYDIAIAMFVYGLLIVLAAWLAGPTRSGVALRRTFAPAMIFRPGLVFGTVAAVYGLVVLWGPTAATRKPLGILLLAALLALGVEVLRRQVATEFPEAREHENRERMATALATARRWRRDEPRRTDEARPAASERVADLERLAALHDRGALTDGEYASQKRLILGG